MKQSLITHSLVQKKRQFRIPLPHITLYDYPQNPPQKNSLSKHHSNRSQQKTKAKNVKRVQKKKKDKERSVQRSEIKHQFKRKRVSLQKQRMKPILRPYFQKPLRTRVANQKMKLSSPNRSVKHKIKVKPASKQKTIQPVMTSDYFKPNSIQQKQTEEQERPESSKQDSIPQMEMASKSNLFGFQRFVYQLENKEEAYVNDKVALEENARNFLLEQKKQQTIFV